MSTASLPEVAALPEDAAARQRRQGELIQATIECISRYGLSGTTLARVAGAAGLSPGIVNFYFDSKDALLLSVLNHIAEEFENDWRLALANADSHPAAKLRALVEASFEPARFDPRRVAVWNAFWGEARARQDYLRVCGERERVYREQVVGLCRNLMLERRSLRGDAEAIGEAMVALLNALPEEVLVDEQAFDPAAARRTCHAFLASVFPEDFSMPAPLAPEFGGGAPAADLEPSTLPQLSQTLPGWVYSNTEFLELEREHLFRRSWLMVGHLGEIPNPGDYMTLDAAEERIAVLRDEAGELNAFHNVCRHRASRVVRGDRGHCSRALTCPYHGWTYNFDGTLRGVPSESSFQDIDKARYSLPRVELDVWQGFVFVRMAVGPGPRVSESMHRFDEELSAYRLESLRPLGKPWQRVMEVNWKCIHDNDNEGYHVRVGHPGLQRLFGDSYYDESFEHGVSRSFSVLREQRSAVWSEGLYQSLLPDLDHLPEKNRRAWLYYGVFPNLSLGVYPDRVEYFQAFPLDSGRSLLRGRSFALPDERRVMRAVRYLNGRINDQVGKEDDKFCYWTDAGLKSSSYHGGPLSEKEVAVRQFHDMIRARIPVARRAVAPGVGCVAEVNLDMQTLT